MPHPQIGSWPCYFATRPCRAPKLVMDAGDPFPMQDKQIIRGYGAAFGCPNADALPFSELPYVTVLDVGSEDIARRIREQGIKLKDAQRLLKRETAQAA